MPITKIGFEKSNTGDTNTIADAEQNIFTSAGVSSLLFNNEKASANALSLSIKADQSLTFGWSITIRRCGIATHLSRTLIGDRR